MKEERKTAGPIGALESVRPFIQTIAIAFVCIVFISLVFIMGLMDLRNLKLPLSGIDP